MASRTSALKRIEGVYALLETMHAGALEQAAALMHEAEAAIAAQSRLKRNAREDAQAALETGDRERWALAEVQRGHSEQLQQNLEVLRVERERLAAEARRIYIASRVQHGQIKTVVDRGKAAARLDEERRAQNAADDRFLARLRWSGLDADPA